MGNFLSIVLSFPAVVYTVLFGASLVYWLFVLLGAARLELHSDGAGDGIGGHDLGDVGGGHDVGDVGGGHDVGDAGGGHDGGGHDGGHDGGDGHHDAGDADGHDGDSGSARGSTFGNLLASLKLRSAPATIVLSMLVLFSWLFTVMGTQAAIAWLSPSAVAIARYVVFGFAPILALPFTSIAVRPLARLFVPPKATGNKDLVGQLCTIRTGSVTDKFGEALLEDGGAGIVVRVRVESDEKLQRGDQAIIVGYDSQRQEFTVAPMEERPAPRRTTKR